MAKARSSKETGQAAAEIWETEHGGSTFSSGSTTWESIFWTRSRAVLSGRPTEKRNLRTAALVTQSRKCLLLPLSLFPPLPANACAAMNQQGVVWVGENTLFFLNKKGLFYSVSPSALPGIVRSCRSARRTLFEGGQRLLNIFTLPGTSGKVKPWPHLEKKSLGPVVLFLHSHHPLSLHPWYYQSVWGRSNQDNWDACFCSL